MTLLAHAEKKYGKIRIDSKAVTSSSMGLPELKEKAQKVQTFAKMQNQLNGGSKDSEDED
jgi:hypothetical protein